MLLPLSYPFFPVQLTLVSSLCIGIPSFLLSFQKSYGHIDEDFFGPVLKNAFPGGLCIDFLHIWKNFALARGKNSHVVYNGCGYFGFLRTV